MAAELKPCPFCGGAPSLALCGFGTARVTCMDCGSEGAYSPSREDAIAAWNRRVPDGVRVCDTDAYCASVRRCTRADSDRSLKCAVVPGVRASDHAPNDPQSPLEQKEGPA